MCIDPRAECSLHALPPGATTPALEGPRVAVAGCWVGVAAGCSAAAGVAGTKNARSSHLGDAGCCGAEGGLGWLGPSSPSSSPAGSRQ